MKLLSEQEANKYLDALNMKIGVWGQVTDIVCSQQDSRVWKSYHAPTHVLQLLNFSQYLAGWLPKGEWKIFQIDNSTGSLGTVPASLLGGVLSSDIIASQSLMRGRTFLFEFGKNEVADNYSELLISNLIFIFLIFELHGYAVSENSAGRVLAIQDGVAHLSSHDDNGAYDIGEFLADFMKNPLASPPWIVANT